MLFQAKTELFVIFHLLLMMIFRIRTVDMVLQLVLYIIICKIKYSFNGPTQKAYKELHFAIDGKFKQLGCRGFYQRMYKIISLMGETYPSENGNTDNEILY